MKQLSKSLLYCSLLLSCICVTHAAKGLMVFTISDLRGGLNNAVDSSLIADNQVSDCLNVFFDEGGVTKRGGRQKYNETALNAGHQIESLYTYQKSNGVHYMICRSSTTLYSSPGNGTWTAFKTSRTDGFVEAFTTFEDKLICTNGQDTVFKWDGSTATDISSATACNFTAAWRERLWLANSSGYESVLFGSYWSDEMTWDATADAGGLEAVEIAVNENDGDVITGIVTYQDKLIIFKTYSTYMLMGYDALDFAMIPLSYEVGCFDNESIAEKDGVLIFLSHKGIMGFDGTKITTLSKNISDAFFESIVQSNYLGAKQIFTTQEQFAASGSYVYQTTTTWSAGDIIPSSWTHLSTTGTDFSACTISPTDCLSTTIVDGSVVCSSWSATDTDWNSGTKSSVVESGGNIQLDMSPINADSYYSLVKHTRFYRVAAVPFTANYGVSIASVGFYGWVDGSFISEIGDVTVSIRADAGGNPSPTVLGTATITEEELSNYPDITKWWDFTFSPAVPITATSSYWFVIRSEKGSYSTGNYYNPDLRGNNDISYAKFSDSTESSWSYTMSDGWVFKPSYRIYTNSYDASGTFTSQIFDTHLSSNIVWGSSTFSGTIPTGTNIGMYVRSGWASNLSDASSWIGVASNGDTMTCPSKRYIQYKAVLTPNTNRDETPILISETMVGRSTGTITSAILDTELVYPVWSNLEENGSITSGITTRTAYVRSSNDSALSGATWHQVEDGANLNDTIDHARYVQWKWDLSTNNGNYSPTATDIQLSAAATGYYISPEATISSISGWGVFDETHTLNGGTVTYTIASSTYSTTYNNYSGWTSITDNTEISITTDTFVRWKATFDLSHATHTPTVASVILNYFSGDPTLPVSSAVYDDRYWIAVATATNNQNDCVLVLDSNWAWTLLDQNISSMCVYRKKLYTGDAATSGYVYREDIRADTYETTDDDGSSIEAYFKTKNYNFGTIAARKRLEEFWVTFAPPSLGTTMTIYNWIDDTGNEYFYPYVTTDTFLCSHQRIRYRKTGNFIKFMVYNKTTSDWNFLSMEIYYTLEPLE